MKYCRICFLEVNEGTTLFEYLHWEDVLCGKCRHLLEEQKIEETFLVKGHTLHVLYVYDTFMESLLFQLKEGRDIALAPIFLMKYKKRFLKRFKKYTLVGAPSSASKSKERGFYALAKLYEPIGKEIHSIYHKHKNIKQSMQNRHHRHEIKKYITLDPHCDIPQTPILIIDDVCTSGATVLACFDLLKEHPYPVEAFVICAHPQFISEHKKKKHRFWQGRRKRVREW